jgi:hypothetical protein
MDQVKVIKSKLRQCKDEWLEEKPGKKGSKTKYIGWDTCRQIIEVATDGITTWDYGIVERFREEVYKLSKDSGQWNFDGYVYHVAAWLYIPGCGYREQFGKKVAVGGVDVQDSGYQAAASSAFAKCAMMFSVGEELYSKKDVVMEDDTHQYQQMQQDPNYYMQPNQPYQQQAFQPYAQQQVAAGWETQPNYQQQYPQAYPQNVENQPNQYQQMQSFPQGAGANTAGTGQITQPQPQEVQPTLAPPPVGWELPFDPTHGPAVQPQPTAQPNAFEAQSQMSAQPQMNAQPQNFQAQPQQFGAPVQGEPPASVQPQEWQQNQVQQEMQRYFGERQRLGIVDDNMLIPFLREFFQNEQANATWINETNLKGFTDYLTTMQR